MNRTLESKEIDANPYWVYKKDSYKIANGEARDYYYAETNGSVLIIPYLEYSRVVYLCKQFRYLMEDHVYEFSGGSIEVGETPIDTAQKELEEELGITGIDFEEIGRMNPCKGITKEVCHIIVCKIDNIGEQKLEQSEDIQRIYVSIDELEDLLISRDVSDGMSLAALALFKSYIKNNK
ncbi:MAG: NUDIX hydrolase [Candidatus Kapaibacteriales bacterium]